jgi:outer membrane scaffolding protein for murein synthesis (MipA/OmpV family)
MTLNSLSFDRAHAPALRIALGLSLGVAGLAHADLKPLWELGAGAAVISFPDYRGSNEQRGYVLPIPYVVYRGEVFQIDRDKIRGLLFKTDRVELDLSVNGSVPVRSGDNQARRDMPNLDPTLELGPSLNVKLVTMPERFALTLRLPVRAVIASDFHTTHDAGVLAHPNVNLDVKGPRQWNLGFVAGPVFGDRRYHNYFYGVAPQFATADRPAYTAHGGYSGMQFIAAASKRFDLYWFGAFVKYDNLQDAAFAPSPLVKTRNNVAGGFAIARVFAQSELRVEAKD